MGFRSLPTVYVHARDVDETANPDKSAVYEFGRKHKGAALSHNTAALNRTSKAS